jgi:RNA-directed DNA polymerase
MQAIRQKIKETVRQHPLSAPIGEVIVDLNRTLDGWGNYFAWSNASRHFAKIDSYTIDQVRLFLRRKHQRKDSRGHRDWPVGFLYQKLGLTRLTGSLTARRSR